MKTATVNELSRNMSVVLDWVKAGEEVELVEGDKPLAIISPPRRRVQHPDYAARARLIFGDKILTPDESEEIRNLNRGEW